MTIKTMLSVSKNIERLLRTDESSRIFIDTCSLMHSSAETLLANISPILIATHKKLIIPKSCKDELYKLSKVDKTSIDSKNALNLIENHNSIIDIRGEASDGDFADNVFKTVFTKFRIKHTLILISEDRRLCKEILQMNDSVAVKGKRIYTFNCTYALGEEKVSKQKITKDKTDHKESIKLTTVSNEIVVPDPIPGLGDYVYTQQGAKIKLIEDFKAGGEGTIYKTDSSSNYVIKIYHKGKLNKRKESKISILIDKGNMSDSLCLPVEKIYNENKQYVGYSMPLVVGRSLDGTIFKGEKGFCRYFKDWSRNDLIDFCINLLETISLLHKNNILIGDINGSNVLIKTPLDFSIIDTDSFQVYGFPCPVGTPEFTAPEIQEKEYDSFLRTIGNENFAIATLLFKILMFGVKPYQKIGSDNFIEDIKNGDFSFPYKGNSNRKIPNGDWCYFWSHLHPKLKKMFYQTFTKGQPHYVENERPSVDDWIKILKRYKDDLSNGYLARVDEESLKLFPKNYKKIPGHKYKTCKICKKECDTYYLQFGQYCNNCLRDSTETKCSVCNEPFYYGNYRIYVLGKTIPTLCPACYQIAKDVKREEKRQMIEREKREREKKEREERERYLQEIRETRTCYVCGNSFDITNGEYEFLRSKNFQMPQRCQACRDAKRFEPMATPESKKDDGCFLTTAACEFYGKEDDCLELTTLREFRDNWLAKQNNGVQEISLYYEIAPKLVEQMKKSPDYGECCEMLMNEYIKPCVLLIQEGRYEDCRQKYIEGLKFMINKYK